MGRGCTMDEWVHFDRLPEEGRVPNSSYWYVHCRHCVRGYEQKQLVNPPAKLTGRRSAMKAHLKVCPLYATQYKMEQRALAAAAAAAAATASVEAADAAAASDAATPTTATADDATASLVGTVTIKTQSGEKRKRRGEDVEASGPRGGRGKHCMMEEWEHFIRLQDEGYIGKSNFFYAVCRHCQIAYDEAPEEKKPLLVPEKMVGRREKMRKHLSHCQFFKGELPSLERRTQVRTVGPNAFLPLPTADGIKMVPASALASVAAIEAAGLGQAGGLGVGSEVVEGTQPTARLALDEWQYFTRLHRKKDSAYYYARCNFCQQAFDNAPEALKNSLTPTVVMGRKSNMQTHLAKCPYVPKDAVLFNKTTLIASPFSAKDDEHKAKRVKISGLLDAGNTAYHQILIEFLLQHRLPFEWIDSLSAKKLLQLAAVGAQLNSNYVPTSEELRTHILDSFVRIELQPEVEKIKQVISLPSSPAAAVDATAAEEGASTNATSGTAQLPVAIKIGASKPAAEDAIPGVSCMISGNGVAVPLQYVTPDREAVDEDSLITGIAAGAPTLSYYHGEDVARYLGSHLRRVRNEYQIGIGIVIAPQSPVMNHAVDLLRAQWPNVAFISSLEDMMAFCLLKTLQNPLVSAVVTAVTELVGISEIQEALAADDFVVTKLDSWTSFAALAQELLSESMAPISAVIEAKVDRASLFRVAGLFRAFASLDGALSIPGRVTLADALMHLATLYTAAEGFEDVQFALEIVWHSCEQPLFLLAHALQPHMRLRGISSTGLTKLSVLSDLGVAYFTQFFERKPLSLRGDMTSYLHMSQDTFSESFIAEFPLVDDYFRYLRDNFPELSALMQLFHSLSMNGVSEERANVNKAHSGSKTGYSDDEEKKLSLLEERWGVEVAAYRGEEAIESGGVSAADVEMTEGEQPAEEEADQSVVAKWIRKLDSKLAGRMVDFSEWETKFADGVTALYQIDETAVTTVDAAATAETTELPSTEHTNATAKLKGHRAKKVRLAQLFNGSETTTV